MGTPIPIIYVIIEMTVGSQFEKHISFPQKEGTARRNIAIVSLFSADTTEAGYKRGRMNSSIVWSNAHSIQSEIASSNLVYSSMNFYCMGCRPYQKFWIISTIDSEQGNQIYAGLVRRVTSLVQILSFYKTIFKDIHYRQIPEEGLRVPSVES